MTMLPRFVKPCFVTQLATPSCKMLLDLAKNMCSAGCPQGLNLCSGCPKPSPPSLRRWCAVSSEAGWGDSGGPWGSPEAWGGWMLTSLSPCSVGEIVAQGVSLGAQRCHLGGWMMWIKSDSSLKLFSLQYSWILCYAGRWNVSVGPRSSRKGVFVFGWLLHRRYCGGDRVGNSCSSNMLKTVSFLF